MYALVKIGGRQYKVSPNETLRINRIHGEVGGEVVLNDVMMVSSEGVVEFGKPALPYTVTLELLGQTRSRKQTTYHFTRRGGHRVKRGWREHYSMVRVKSIEKGA